MRPAITRKPLTMLMSHGHHLHAIHHHEEATKSISSINRNFATKKPPFSLNRPWVTSASRPEWLSSHAMAASSAIFALNVSLAVAEFHRGFFEH
jgi:hypothetical protein